MNLLYSGTGEMRITSGSRQSPSVPLEVEVFEQLTAAFAAAGDAQRQLAAAAFGFGWGHDLQGVGHSAHGSTVRGNRSALRDLARSAASSPALSNISSDARNGASPRIGGLDSCQPSAPVVGTNRGPSGTRVSSRSPTSRRTAGARLRMALVDEAAGDRAGSRVHVLVMAPHREIGIAVVQLQRHVAGGMRQVEAGDGALRRAPGERFPSGRRPGRVRYWMPGHSDGRQSRAVFADRALDRLHRDGTIHFVRLDLDEARCPGSKPWTRICDSTA